MNYNKEWIIQELEWIVERGFLTRNDPSNRFISPYMVLDAMYLLRRFRSR